MAKYTITDYRLAAELHHRTLKEFIAAYPDTNPDPVLKAWAEFLQASLRFISQTQEAPNQKTNEKETHNSY